jgi:formamidopyrimidine-DNA glycosylase
MPELPEVETVRRGLEPAMAGATILALEQRREALRFPLPENFARRLTGRRITALGRRAKYLVADLDDGNVLLMHLGMTGRFIGEDTTGLHEPGDFYLGGGRHLQHDHIVFTLSSGARVTYNDARRFGFMDLVPRADLATGHFSGLGIEPLGNELSGALLAALFSGRRTPVKAALLDQRLIAGLGNIYVCEALHRAGIHPARMTGSLVGADGGSTPTLEALAGAIRAVLEEAIAVGGSTLRDFAHTDGSLGYFQHRFRVYNREGEPCRREGCGGTIRRLVQSGRSSYFCDVCQQ